MRIIAIFYKSSKYLLNVSKADNKRKKIDNLLIAEHMNNIIFVTPKVVMQINHLKEVY